MNCETQLIEDQEGKVWALLRQEEQNCYCISVSDDGCETWKSVDNKNILYPNTFILL